MQKIKRNIYYFLLTDLYFSSSFLILKKQLNRCLLPSNFIQPNFFKTKSIILKYPCEFIRSLTVDEFENHVHFCITSNIFTNIFYFKYKKICFQADEKIFRVGKQIFLFFLTFCFY